MRLFSIAGVAWLCGLAGVSGAALDDQIKAFEAAVKATPVAKSGATSPFYPMGRVLTVEDFDLAVQRDSTNESNIEQLVQQLMATHSSDAVRHAGEDLIGQLESRRKTREDAFASEANAVLAKAVDAVKQAKKPGDLDEILQDLRTLQNPQGETDDEDDAGPSGLAGKIGATFRFVTQWQDYLSASGSGNRERAQNSLHAILENRQIDAPTFFPRSEILARLVQAEGGNPAESNPPDSTPAATDPDPILAKITKPEDLEPALPQLARVGAAPGMGPWDWSGLQSLAKARDDAIAGLAVDLNVNQVMNGPVWGDNISRIEAMELLVILPHYLGTEVSEPPKGNETVTAYLDRLAADASTGGNLPLLQRALAMKVALGTTRDSTNGPAPGTQQFLAGLSLDAGGQYEPAVIAYEHALTGPDVFLPVKIVSDRLAAIKAAHPDEFQKGLTAFLTPPEPVSPYGNPMLPPWARPTPFNPYAPYNRPVTPLPLPMTITIPATSAPAAAPATTNAPAGNPPSPAR